MRIEVSGYNVNIQNDHDAHNIAYNMFEDEMDETDQDIAYNVHVSLISKTWVRKDFGSDCYYDYTFEVRNV